MMAFSIVRDFETREQALAERAGANEEFKQRLRDRERRVFEAIATAYGFPDTSVVGEMLEVAGASGDFVADFLDPAARGRYGASVVTTATAGAITGSALDAVGGMGIGTVLGLVGGGVIGHYVGRRIIVDIDAKGTLSIASLSPVRYSPILVNRAVSVWTMFATRSHARRGDVALEKDASAVGAAALAKLTRLAARCGRNRHWSSMDDETDRGAQRARTVDDLADVVRPLLGLDRR
jgi:hypothetical protein